MSAFVLIQDVTVLKEFDAFEILRHSSCGEKATKAAAPILLLHAGVVVSNSHAKGCCSKTLRRK